MTLTVLETAAAETTAPTLDDQLKRMDTLVITVRDEYTGINFSSLLIFLPSSKLSPPKNFT